MGKEMSTQKGLYRRPESGARSGLVSGAAVLVDAGGSFVAIALGPKRKYSLVAGPVCRELRDLVSEICSPRLPAVASDARLALSV